MFLTEEHQLIQDSARQLAEKVIKPNREKWESEKKFPHEAIQSLAEGGFMGMLVPEQWGGSNIGILAYALVIQEIAKADGGISTILSVHNSVASLPILNYGSSYQQENFLVPMAKGKMLGAFCLTEPQAGSDAGNLITLAKHVKDGFVLNGVKQFVTSGQQADIAIVFAATDSSENKKEISAFIVPTKTVGFAVAKIEQKMGQSLSEIAQIVLENVHIPEAYLLGKIGEGKKIAFSTLESGRIGIAAQAIGMASEALRLSMLYSQERQTFGKFLHEHQAVAFKLADMATQLMAAQQLLYHAAQLKDNQQRCIKEASMAKLFATEVAQKICYEAMQIFGGYGYLQDFPIERIFRDVRVTTLYEGTSDIQRMIIKKELF